VAGGHSATIYPDGRIRGDRKFSLLVNALGSVWRKFYESRSTLDFVGHQSSNEATALAAPRVEAKCRRPIDTRCPRLPHNGELHWTIVELCCSSKKDRGHCVETRGIPIMRRSQAGCI
ncbi:hypothetical protein, partial [Ralstonia pseudosolanacearum]|uniref:hypothetical protein n=1 Tax=Ralstonia pseudosolanacearum TaxID=1310165 RepID=UPI002005CF4F